MWNMSICIQRKTLLEGNRKDGRRRKRYSHPIRAIHYSAPERKAGRTEGGGNHRKRDEGLRNMQAADDQPDKGTRACAHTQTHKRH